MTIIAAEMPDKIATRTAHKKAVALPVAVGERELRLDLFRGLALWLIFIDHLACYYDLIQ